MNKLELILEGEAPYDIFVRCKPLEKQPIDRDHDIITSETINRKSKPKKRSG